MGWGGNYLISALDDVSRYVLAWELKSSMKTESISEVVKQAIAHRAQLWPTVSSSGRPHVPSLQPSATVFGLHLSIGALIV